MTSAALALATRGQFEANLTRSIVHSERCEQREVMIDCVDEPDLRGNELVITQLPERLATDGVVCDPPLCAREQGEKSRAIGARKVEAAIKFRLGDGEKLRCVRDSPARDERPIKAGNGGQQFARAVGDDERDVCRGKGFSQRGDRGDRQDQVADPFELDEKDVQPTPSAPSASPVRKRRANARGNGPT